MESKEIKHLYVKDFIRIELSDRIGELIQPYPFLSFPLICMGIEFLGKCLDEECPFSKIKYGHFERCIFELMPRYSNIVKNNKNDTISFDLKAGLRNGFAHQFRPSGKFLLSPIESKNTHLEIKNGAMVLRIDELYKDFRTACEKLISDIEGKDKYPEGSKVYDVYMVVTPD
jgi:hypothetical protein